MAPTTQPNRSNSALALLSGRPAPAQPAASAAAPNAVVGETAKHVGTWQAVLSNDASIRLDLKADGSFSWIASKNGKQSRFDGQFAITDGTLTLARASDNQKLKGAITFNGTGFHFQLDGAKDSGLTFSQQS